MFVANITRPDIHQKVSVLSTRVKETNENDCQKLFIMINYLNGTKKNYLNLNSGVLKVVKLYVETSFVVHPDFNSHTGAIFTMVQGVMHLFSRK